MSEGRAQPFCSVQDQIQSGILFLTRQLQNLSSHERKQCLEEVWDWARQRADLLSLQVIRGYRECCRRSGPTYLRHRAWYWGNRDNPEFWAEWERRFSVPATDGTAESIRGQNWSCVSSGTRSREGRRRAGAADPALMMSPPPALSSENDEAAGRNFIGNGLISRFHC